MKLISSTEFQALLAAVNKRSPFGERDVQFLRLLATTGLRVAELVGLCVGDVWQAGQVRTTLFVRAEIAKGHRSRQIPLCRTASEAVAGLVAFLSARGFSTDPGAPLLVDRRHRRLTVRQVQLIVQQLREKAGVAAATPHSMRHMFATQLVERTQDVVAVSRLLGHRRLTSTMVYTASSPERLAAVVSALD